MIDATSKELEARINRLALKAAGVGAIPGPAVLANINKELILQTKQLGIDEVSITEMAVKFGVDKESIMKCFILEISEEDEYHSIFEDLLGSLGEGAAAAAGSGGAAAAGVRAAVAGGGRVLAVAAAAAAIAAMAVSASMSAELTSSKLSHMLKIHTTIAKKSITNFTEKAMKMEK